MSVFIVCLSQVRFVVIIVLEFIYIYICVFIFIFIVYGEIVNFRSKNVPNLVADNLNFRVILFLLKEKYVNVQIRVERSA